MGMYGVVQPCFETYGSTFHPHGRVPGAFSHLANRQQVILAEDVDDEPRSLSPENETTKTTRKFVIIVPATSTPIDASTQTSPPATPMVNPKYSLATSIAPLLCPKAMPDTVSVSTQTSPPGTPETPSSTRLASSLAPTAPNQGLPRLNPSAAAFKPLRNTTAGGPSTLTPVQFAVKFPKNGTRGP
ncbi:MAG: hypothetical protein Q9226_008401 [Calogaya cf. arnoldii]